MKKPVVYIASAYTRGDPAVNVHFQCQTFNELMSDGLVWPIAPLWTHFQHTVFPRPYSDWIAYDKALLHLYDACLRLTAICESMEDYAVADSSGADGEVAFFKNVDKPVFYSKKELYNWARQQ